MSQEHTIASTGSGGILIIKSLTRHLMSYGCQICQTILNRKSEEVLTYRFSSNEKKVQNQKIMMQWKKMVKNFAQFDFPILRRRMSVNSLKIALVREVLQISPFYCPLWTSHKNDFQIIIPMYIAAISGALFPLRIQYEFTQTQCDEGARDGIDIWYMGIKF